MHSRHKDRCSRICVRAGSPEFSLYTFEWFCGVIFLWCKWVYSNRLDCDENSNTNATYLRSCVTLLSANKDARRVHIKDLNSLKFSVNDSDDEKSSRRRRSFSIEHVATLHISFNAWPPRTTRIQDMHISIVESYLCSSVGVRGCLSSVDLKMMFLCDMNEWYQLWFEYKTYVEDETKDPLECP